MDFRTKGLSEKRAVTIRANTTLGRNLFWNQTIPDWNLLPTVAIESKTVAQFKSQLVDYKSAILFSPSSLILHIKVVDA